VTCHFYENGIELTCSGDNELFCPQMQVKKVYFFFFFLQSFISLAHNTYISHYTTLSLLHFKKQIYLTYILNPPIPYPHPAIQCKQRRKRKGYYDDSKITHFSLKKFIFLLVREKKRKKGHHNTKSPLLSISV